MKENKAIFTGFRSRILIHQMHMLVNLVYFPDQWSISQIPTRKTFSLIPVEELPQYDVRRKGGFSFHDNTHKGGIFSLSTHDSLPHSSATSISRVQHLARFSLEWRSSGRKKYMSFLSFNQIFPPSPRLIPIYNIG